MGFQLNQNLKFFNWNKFRGGGEGGVHSGATLATFIILMSETSVCWVPFNHDKAKLRTKLTCLLRMNLETRKIPPSIMLPVLSFSVKFGLL